MRHRQMTALLLGAGLACSPAGAATLSAGAFSWDSELEGTMASGSEPVDLDDELGFGYARQSGALLQLEHSASLLPNVRLRYLALRANSNAQPARTLQFSGDSFAAGQTLHSDLDLAVLDGTLYFAIPRDDDLRLDVGLTVRSLDGEMVLESASQQAQQSIDDVLPQLHLAARYPFRLISDNAYVGADANGIVLGQDKLADFTLKAGWRSDFLFGLEVGFNQMFVKLDENSDNAINLKFGGPYLALTLAFQ